MILGEPAKFAIVFDVVKECNRLGIIVDVSHLSDKGFWQVLETSSAPVIASHSDARALCPGQLRNLTDDMLRGADHLHYGSFGPLKSLDGEGGADL